MSSVNVVNNDEQQSLLRSTPSIAYDSITSEVETWREYKDMEGESKEVSHDYVGTTARPLPSSSLRLPHFEVFMVQISSAAEDRRWHYFFIAFVIFFIIILIMRILTHPIFTKH